MILFEVAGLPIDLLFGDVVTNEGTNTFPFGPIATTERCFLLATAHGGGRWEPPIEATGDFDFLWYQNSGGGATNQASAYVATALLDPGTHQGVATALGNRFAWTYAFAIALSSDPGPEPDRPIMRTKSGAVLRTKSGALLRWKS